MKNKYYIYLVLLLISIIFFSCKREEKQIKGREYITESGFKTETSEEIRINETATEVFDIKKHPEMWSMTDKETYIYILEDVLDDLNGYKFFNKLPLSDNFRKKSKNGIFDYIKRLDRPSDDWEKYSVLFEPDFDNKTIWCKTFSWSSERQHLIKYYLDEYGNLDNIEVLKTELLYDRVAERESESIANRPISYESLERYKEVIPQLVYPFNYGELEWYTEDEQEKYISEVYKKYNNYEGCTKKFLEKYNPMNGILSNEVCGADEYNSLTDLSEKCIGIEVSYWDELKGKYYYRYYKVYFEVDDRNFLDAITKVEEVLEDGSVVEVENNFGK